MKHSLFFLPPWIITLLTRSVQSPPPTHCSLRRLITIRSSCLLCLKSSFFLCSFNGMGSSCSSSVHFRCPLQAASGGSSLVPSLCWTSSRCLADGAELVDEGAGLQTRMTAGGTVATFLSFLLDATSFRSLGGEDVSAK